GGTPEGELHGTLEAESLAGIARLAERMAPDSPFTLWLGRSAPALAPATLEATLSADADAGGRNRLVASGRAGGTDFHGALSLVGGPSSWRTSEAGVRLSLAGADSVTLARQAGLDALPIADTGPASLELDASGVPEDGLEGRLTLGIAGVTSEIEGRLTLAAGAPPGFDLAFSARAATLDEALLIAGVSVPGIDAGTGLELAGRLTGSASDASFAFD